MYAIVVGAASCPRPTMYAAVVTAGLAFTAALFAARSSVTVFPGTPVVAVAGNGECVLDTKVFMVHTMFEEDAPLGSLALISRELFRLNQKCRGGFVSVSTPPNRQSVVPSVARCCTEEVAWWQTVLPPRVRTVSLHQAMAFVSEVLTELSADATETTT